MPSTILLAPQEPQQNPLLEAISRDPFPCFLIILTILTTMAYLNKIISKDTKNEILTCLFGSRLSWLGWTVLISLSVLFYATFPNGSENQTEVLGNSTFLFLISWWHLFLTYLISVTVGLLIVLPIILRDGRQSALKSLEYLVMLPAVFAFIIWGTDYRTKISTRAETTIESQIKLVLIRTGFELDHLSTHITGIKSLSSENASHLNKLITAIEDRKKSIKTMRTNYRNIQSLSVNLPQKECKLLLGDQKFDQFSAEFQKHEEDYKNLQSDLTKAIIMKKTSPHEYGLLALAELLAIFALAIKTVKVTGEIVWKPKDFSSKPTDIESSQNVETRSNSDNSNS